MTDTQSILKLIRMEHFFSLLYGSERLKEANSIPQSMTMEQTFHCPSMKRFGGSIAITCLKTNKAAAELFKHDGEELIRSMQQLLYRIWSGESIPDD